MNFIRGAITVDADTPDEIRDKTAVLLQEMAKRNQLTAQNVKSILFSTTQDIRSFYPAKAARACGFENAALFSALEPPIEGSLPLCIRVLIVAENPLDKPVAVYLGNAATLRKDLSDRMTVALDGPAGSGKSTVARLLARSYGILHLDTGAMYRACALKLLREGVLLSDEKAVEKTVAGLDLEVRFEGNGQRTVLDGEDVSEAIRDNEVSKAASAVAAMRPVREKMVALQREIAAKQSCVLDGRDIGTTVLPNAKYKFFLTASVAVRAKRRYDELKAKGADDIDFEVLKKEIEERDYRDSHREISPLKQAKDAVLIDTSDMTAEEAAATVRRKIQEKI